MWITEIVRVTQELKSSGTGVSDPVVGGQMTQQGIVMALMVFMEAGVLKVFIKQKSLQEQKVPAGKYQQGKHRPSGDPADEERRYTISVCYHFVLTANSAFWCRWLADIFNYSILSLYVSRILLSLIFLTQFPFCIPFHLYYNIFDAHKKYIE